MKTLNGVDPENIPPDFTDDQIKILLNLDRTQKVNILYNSLLVGLPMFLRLASIFLSVPPEKGGIPPEVIDDLAENRTAITDLARKRKGPVEEWMKEYDNIEIINDLFNDGWGEDSKPLTAISLKQAEAQGGKAKALLNKYANAKEDYNLTKDEIEFDNDQFIEGIENLREKVKKN